jgi:osmotically-inducible protein OsmY
MKRQIRMMVMVAVSVLGAATLVTTGCKSNSGSEEKRTAGTYIDDSSITAKIKSKMVGDSVVKAHQINVDTFQGNVQLNGFVDNEAQKQRAEEIARNTSGVLNVQNNLQLRPEAAGAGRTYNSNQSSGAQIHGQAGGAEINGKVQTNP